FSMRELVARLKALLRRVRRAGAPAPSEAEKQDALQFGDLVIDRAGRRVMRAGTPAHLTPTEFDLLLCLAGAPGTVLTREQLLADVWDWIDATGTRTVDSHVKALRRKLGSDLVRTVHGVGDALEIPEDPEDEAEATGTASPATDLSPIPSPTLPDVAASSPLRTSSARRSVGSPTGSTGGRWAGSGPSRSSSVSSSVPASPSPRCSRRCASVPGSSRCWRCRWWLTWRC